MFTPRELSLERGWPGRIDGDRVIQLAAQTLQSFFTGGGTAREHAEFALEDVVLRAPVLQPPSIRDFYAFEQHVRTARASRGLDVPREWFEIPVFYFSNPTAVYGPVAGCSPATWSSSRSKASASSAIPSGRPRSADILRACPSTSGSATSRASGTSSSATTGCS